MKYKATVDLPSQPATPEPQKLAPIHLSVGELVSTRPYVAGEAITAGTLRHVRAEGVYDVYGQWQENKFSITPCYYRLPHSKGAVPEPPKPVLVSANELRDGEIVAFKNSNGTGPSTHGVDLRFVRPDGLFSTANGRCSTRTSLTKSYYRYPAGTKITLEVV